MQTIETIATIDNDELPTVTGGTSSANTQLTQAMTQIQTSLSSLSNNNNNNQSSQMMPLVMMAAMSRRW